MKRLLLLATLLGAPLAAQELTQTPVPEAQVPEAPYLTGSPTVGVQTAPAADDAKGAVLRGLDKMAGATKDLDVPDGQSVAFGDLKIAVSDCRFPKDNPSSDAWAHVTVAGPSGAPLFDGWMVASSPALSALDHPRYDVWVIRCMSS